MKRMSLFATEKVDLNAKNGYGRTPLMVAVEKASELLVNLFLTTGKVDLDVKDKDSQTAAMMAWETGQLVFSRILLPRDRAEVSTEERCSPESEEEQRTSQ